MIGLLPSPLDRGEIKVKIKGNGGVVKPSAEEPFAALVFKTVSDPYTGRISLFRVFSGKVNPDVSVTNVSKEADEKLGGLFFLQGKEQIPAGQVKSGDIFATYRRPRLLLDGIFAFGGSSLSPPAEDHPGSCQGGPGQARRRITDRSSPTSFLLSKST